MNTPKRTRNKIANIYLNEETHATLKALAAHQETTIQNLAAHWLEETQPVMAEMVKAFDDIKNGKNMTDVLTNLMGQGLKMAGDQILDKKEDENATDNRQSD